MCGVGGVINNKHKLSHNEILDIAYKVKFRGPDSTRTVLLDSDFSHGGISESAHAFYFNRLAIVDLNSWSDQPFIDEKYMLLFNGEIYNYKSIKRQLEGEGIQFKTYGDTEVLFEALKLWGVQAISLLNGMFAFAFINLYTREVLLARDRLGIKPLYYSIDGDTLCFSSECDSIVRLQKKSIDVDHDVLQSYLWLQYTPTPKTIHQSIYKLPPGSFMQLDARNASNYTIKTYWNAYTQLTKPQDTRENDLAVLLTDSLNMQIHADVPVGVFLSSGVDSSLLAAIINNSFTKEGKIFDFFTVAFDEAATNDESGDAVRFLNAFKNPSLKQHVLSLASEEVLFKAQQLYSVYDEPFADPAALLNWSISEKAREHVTVVLSGDGADELFWGYERYNLWRQLSLRNKKNPFSSAMKAWLQESFKGKFNTVYSTDDIQLHYNLLKNRFLEGKNPLHFEALWLNSDVANLSGRQDVSSLLDMKSYLPDAMLYKVDRSSMAASIEVRVPYLDNRVIDYALSLPFNKKVNDSYASKAILKKLLVELAPQFNIHQQKKGFSMPLKKWLKNEWKTSVYEVLKNTSWKDFGLEEKLVSNILNLFYSNKKDATREIWHLYNFGLWLKTKKEILN